MITCPVCGYDPSPPVITADRDFLEKKRVRDLFVSHAQQSFWVSQTECVCNWLKKCGVMPRNVIDAGCGDGRWIFGIEKAWPDCSYVGIERLSDHILNNREQFPDKEFVLGDICDYEPDRRFDLALLMGVFNPKMRNDIQFRFIQKITALAPFHIACLFDRNTTGEPPHEGLKYEYKLVNALNIPKKEQSPRQNNVVWLYERL